MAVAIQWPTAREFSEALQNPAIVFSDPFLKSLSASLDKFGMPVIATGNFAAVCKMSLGSDNHAIRFFTRDPGDREQRYKLIDAFLAQRNVPCIADFAYRPQAILIGGRRYPIIQMEWIQGMRLDLYVEALLKTPTALRALADSWLRIVGELQEAQVAHGDLQHGNVLVDGAGGLRLVDLDGMCVPGMERLGACEEGHRYYQHPQRHHSPFNCRIDRFPALVIYLSLLALEKKPELWNKFHDDNLIFKRADFVNPSASPLVTLLKNLPGEIGTLTELLISALTKPASDTPALLEFAKPTSNLPTWMQRGTAILVTTKTRETSVDQRIGPKFPQPPGDQPKPTASAVLSKGITPHPVVPSKPAPMDWGSILVGAIWPAAILALVASFLGGYSLVEAILKGIGLIARRGEGHIAFGTYLLICYGIAVFIRARGESKAPYASSGSVATTPTTQSSPSTQPSLPPNPTPAQRPSSAGAQVVASRIRTKYHRPTCRWAYKISRSNRISFPSPAAAARAGLRPCTECNP